MNAEYSAASNASTAEFRAVTWAAESASTESKTKSAGGDSKVFYLFVIMIWYWNMQHVLELSATLNIPTQEVVINIWLCWTGKTWSRACWRRARGARRVAISCLLCVIVTWQASTPPLRTPAHSILSVTSSLIRLLHTVLLMIRTSAFCRTVAAWPGRRDDQLLHNMFIDWQHTHFLQQMFL